MSKKRVHEIAKERGVESKALLAELKAAGVDVKTVSSSVDESLALRALSTDGAAGANGPQRRRPAPPALATSSPAPTQPAPQACRARTSPAPPQPPAEPPPAPSVAGRPRLRRKWACPRPEARPPERVRPTRDSRTGERAPAGASQPGAAAW